jgi:DNA repair protein RadA/Sms
MPTKMSSQFSCQACGAIAARWVGRCTSCGTWDSLVEEVSQPKAGKKALAKTDGAKPVGAIDADRASRVETGIRELDRVLGGGVVLGGVTLVGGDPGVGKSTLLMQALAGLARQGHRCLYISGEESAAQTAARARRLGAVADELLILAENDVDVIDKALTDVKPRVLVVDSVQTMRSSTLDSAAGTVSQLREVTARLVERSKKDHIATFLVGHVTKDGALAGPKVLEHLVDTVLAFEGDRSHALRALRTQKNRFGSATEVGVFEMTEAGMREVASPSALFLAERPKDAPGSVILATCEGTRSMLVEVQALVGSLAAGSARRTANGVDTGRLAMILAVLERKCGLQIGGLDVFLNVAGGVRVDEPAVDLAVALAVASSLKNVPVAAHTVVFGEVGLTGEVRGVSRADARLSEASAMGFARAIAPASAALAGRKQDDRLELVGVKTLDEALDATFR